MFILNYSQTVLIFVPTALDVSPGLEVREVSYRITALLLPLRKQHYNPTPYEQITSLYLCQARTD